MQDVSSIYAVLSRISFPDFKFVVKTDKGLYLQIECLGKCNVTGNSYEWKSRKWVLSYYMTNGEIVQTAFKAVLTAIEHEARENFRYRGVSIFDPHYDIEKLVELHQAGTALKERDPISA